MNHTYMAHRYSAKKKREPNFPPINISVVQVEAAGWQAEMRTKVFCKVSVAAATARQRRRCRGGSERFCVFYDHHFLLLALLLDRAALYYV